MLNSVQNGEFSNIGIIVITKKMTSKMKLTFKKILYKFKTNHMGVIYPG